MLFTFKDHYLCSNSFALCEYSLLWCWVPWYDRSSLQRTAIPHKLYQLSPWYSCTWLQITYENSALLLLCTTLIRWIKRRISIDHDNLRTCYEVELKSGTKLYEILENQQQLAFLVKIQNGSAYRANHVLEVQNVNISSAQPKEGDITQ